MAVAHNQTFHIKDAADRKGGLVEVYLYDTTTALTGRKLICTGWDESPHSKEFNVDDFFRLYEKELKRCMSIGNSNACYDWSLQDLHCGGVGCDCGEDLD